MRILRALSFVFMGICVSMWFGCAPKYTTVHLPPEGETHMHYQAQTRTLGDRHYHATMNYDPRAGIIGIEFSDENEYPVKILRVERVRAVLTQAGGETKEFYFYNPEYLRYHFGSYRVVGHRYHYPPTDILHVQYDWLKDLSSFTLKIWIPMRSATYVVEYVYNEQSGQ